MLFQQSYDDKPRTYQNQATVETVDAGIPYYVASPKFGFEGLHQPVAGTVSNIGNLDQVTTSLWVTCTKSRHQFDKPTLRCSLWDDGVIHQTYNPRLAFLDLFSAKHYAETGKLPE